MPLSPVVFNHLDSLWTILKLSISIFTALFRQIEIILFRLRYIHFATFRTHGLIIAPIELA